MRRTLGALFMAVASIGAVLCLLAIPAVWVVRQAALERVSETTTTVTDPLQQADQTIQEIRDRVQTLSQRLHQSAEQTQAAATAGTIDPQLATRLLAIFDRTIGPEYQALRDAYITLRERRQAALQARQRLQGLLPGFQAPAPAATDDDVSAIAQQLSALDQALLQIRADLTSGSLPGVPLLTQIAQAQQQLEAGLNALVTRLDQVTARIAQAQATVTDFQASATRAVTIAVLVVSLLSLYFAGLHVALFASGRRLWSHPSESTAQPALNLAPTTPGG